MRRHLLTQNCAAYGIYTMVSNVEVWKRLRAIKALRFESKSYSGIGWSGCGSGTVEVEAAAPDVLLFRESGAWQQDGGIEMRFRNVFRWTLIEDHLRLEHLRFGAAQPVFLFDMSPDSSGVWRELAPHPCRDDCYRASMHLKDQEIVVSWRVSGPTRDEILKYVYT